MAITSDCESENSSSILDIHPYAGMMEWKT